MTENTKAVDALAECNNAGHQDYLATARKALEHDRARPRRWELRISPQKIDIIDKTDIINVTKADDHVDPIDKTDAVNVNKTADPVDPDGPVDLLQPYSEPAPDESPMGDGDTAERAAIQEFDGESS